MPEAPAPWGILRKDWWNRTRYRYDIVIGARSPPEKISMNFHAMCVRGEAVAILAVAILVVMVVAVVVVVTVRRVKINRGLNDTMGIRQSRAQDREL
ncbi:hypothetical protein E2C01_042874 [Portunus trituberculatus]|uniref:Uncharacterized protein n=1 Tax=Portunus trituberculatus TaxID=210409 RepID=A0A5B7FN10_PORTR|nr:hypothetical protein [Portunus trituberculatus]